MVKVLMVCTGNTCRSAMAAALFKKRAQERQIAVEVDSAGLSAFIDEPATDQAITVMNSYGIDLSGHRAKRLDPKQLDQYDLILVMAKSQRQQILNLRPDLENKVFLLKDFAAQKMQESNAQNENLNRADSDVSDPYGQAVEVYQRTAAELLQAVDAILDAWQ